MATLSTTHFRETGAGRGRRIGCALIKPWLSALVAPDGYSITMTKHFERAGMHYWGAVAKR